MCSIKINGPRKLCDAGTKDGGVNTGRGDVREGPANWEY